MRHKWHVELRGDLWVITRGDGKVRLQVPRDALQQQMAAHGVVADIYDDLCDQLEGRGRAEVIAGPMGSLSQL